MSATTDEFFTAAFAERPVMVILRGAAPDRTVELCRRAHKAGVRLCEIPVQDPSAFPSLEAAIAWGRENNVVIGAGTVLDPATLEHVVSLGAQFTVAPGLEEATVRRAQELGVPHLPGVATATEVQAALALGCTWLKAFPASTLGPAWFIALHGPFPAVRFVATGGIDVDNAPAYLKAGAAAVSLGSSFADADPAQIATLTLA